ncbi:hypothetical protein ACWOC1_11610 [Enterococcus quebecensis]|uniref:Uncharacterized protein n=2 Tax=Enterococcus quebecensis TaxID=903983 RepID=A0A1E5GS88_9ENTE|nr:hypothetical protein BCR23_08740 [Enterococcus quebecensis]OJG74675.1 hypothetical protein RV12_GL002430 [Enterococcus quebecensis]
MTLQSIGQVSPVFAETTANKGLERSELENDQQKNEQNQLIQDNLHIVEIPKVKTDSIDQSEHEVYTPETLDTSEPLENEKQVEPVAIAEEIIIDGYTYVKVGTRQAFLEAANSKKNIVLTADVELLSGDKAEIVAEFRLLGRTSKAVKKNKLTLNTFSETEQHRGLYALEASFGFGDVHVSDIFIDNKDNGGIISFEERIIGTQYFDAVEYTSNGGQAFVAKNGIIVINDSTFTQTSTLERYNKAFAETSHLFLSGKTTINHDGFSNDVRVGPFLSIQKSSISSGRVEILKNAVVSIETKKSFVTGTGYSDFTLEVGENAAFTLKVSGDLIEAPTSQRPLHYIFGEESAVTLMDESRKNKKTGMNLARFVPLRGRSGELVISAGMDLIIDSNNRYSLIEQETVEDAIPIVIPATTKRVILQNARSDSNAAYNGKIFNLIGNDKGNLFVNSSRIDLYRKGNLSVSTGAFINVTAAVNQNGRGKGNTKVISSTNRNFADTYAAIYEDEVAKIRFAAEVIVPLEIDDIKDTATKVTGISHPDATIQMSGFFTDGEAFNQTIDVSKDRTFSYQLPKTLKVGSTVSFSASVGGEGAVTRVEKQVIDTLPPSAEPLLQTVSINEVAELDLTKLVKNIQDNSGIPPTVEVANTLEAKVGRQQLTVRLTDGSNNFSEIIVPIFVYDENSRVFQTSEKSGFLLWGLGLEVYPEDVTGDITDYLNQRIERKVWSEVEELPSADFILESTDLEEIPLPGSYQANFTYKEYVLTVKIQVMDKKQKINVMIPKKVLFGSSDVLSNQIISPQYEVKNNSQTSITLSVLGLTEEAVSDFELVDLFDKDKQKQQASMSIKTEDAEVHLNTSMGEEVLGYLSGESSKAFRLQGSYFGTYEKILQPKYKIKLGFQVNDEK